MERRSYDYDLTKDRVNYLKYMLGRNMKNHKRLIRIFYSLILLPRDFVTTQY